MFQACRTQWACVGSPGGMVVTGLRYEAVEAVMRVVGVADPADCLARIQVMEAEALRWINRRED